MPATKAPDSAVINTRPATPCAYFRSERSLEASPLSSAGGSKWLRARESEMT